MAERIEIPVSLGLKDAMEQAAELRKILTTDVKPNTHSYEVILKLLNKIDLAASGLKGKIGTAFQTSKGSASFLREYEKLFDLLKSAKDQFADIGLTEIKLNATDTAQVEDYTRKIRTLQEQIDAVQNNGKLGGFFNADEFKTAKNLLDQLKIDPSKLTFTGLQDQLRKFADDADKRVKALEAQFQNVKNIADNLGKGNLGNLNDELKKATENADGLARKITDNKEQIDVNKSLRDAFASNSALNLSVGQIKQNESVSDFVDKETTRIKEAFNRRIAELKHLEPQINDALVKLGQKATVPLDWKTLKANIKSDDFKKLFSDLGMEKAYQQYIKGIESKTDADGIALANKMQKTLESLNNVTDLETTRDKLVSEVERIFKTAGTAVIESAAPFKKSLQEIFANNNINISGTGVEDLISKIKDGDSVATILDNITKSLQAYSATAGRTTSNDQKYKDETEALTLLKKALTEVLKAESDVSGNIAGKNGEIQTFSDLIQKIRENAQKGISIPVGTGELEKGKTALEQFLISITKLEGKQKSLGNVQSAITRWMGFYQVLNLTKKAINDMKQHIQELDSVMTKIAVVTNMTQSDLWKQIGKYSEIARQYGVAIKGVYEVSQIYYQQGLNKGDVMGLTTETLKMARIAGIDYATAADYMTTAIRGFKLEMSDAAHVTDVFSNLAAHTASSTEELATAISKTAASAASVGASFEATSAMMATMIATTRESATNIGTALKSIISRYGEMKENPEGKDSEGEDYSLNKVDTALQSIGISIHDVNGEFRDFDDVILELGEKWNTIDKNAQRYIATVMAGNRQQSRFLALISNVEEYKRALELAQDSSDAGDLQMLKTLDSVDAKIEQMKVTIQEFYTSSGIEQMYKNILDTITNVISAANDMPKAFGKIPLTAMAVGMSIVSTIKSVLTLIIGSISAAIESVKANNASAFQGLINKFYQTGVQGGEALQKGLNQSTQGLGNSLTKTLSGVAARYAGAIASVMGSNLVIGGMNKYGSSTTEDQDRAAGKEMLGGFGLNVFGGALSGAASGAAMGAAAGVPGMAIGAALGTISSLVTNIGSLISGMDMLNVSLARQIELSQKRLEAAKTEETKAKANEKELNNSYEKLIELQEHQFDSIESAKEYTDYMNQLSETYPAFVSTIEASGDVIIDVEKMEQALATARLKTATATLSAVKAEQNSKELQLQNYNQLQSGIGELQKDASFNEVEIYKLLFDDVVEFSDRRASAIIGRYNEWAEKAGKEQVTVNPIGLQTYEEAARSWMNTHPEELNAFMESSILITDQEVEKGSNQASALDSAQNKLAENYIKLLSDAQEAAEKAGETLDLDYLVNEDIESLDDIKSWSYTKIKSTLEITKNRIQDYINSTNETLEQVNTAIVHTSHAKYVQESINDLSNSGEEGKQKASTLQDYTGLITNMLSGRFPHVIDWTEKSVNKPILDALEEWVYMHQDQADQLMNLDYSQYRSFNDINWDELLVDMDAAAAEAYKEKTFKPAFEAVRTSMTAGMTTQLSKAGLENSVFSELIDGTSDTNGEIVSSLIPSLRSGIAEYTKLMKNNVASVANNYLESLKAVYEAIGGLKSDQQIEIASIITTLDFSDKDNLLKAAEQLRDLGYTDLAGDLENAAKRLVVNIGIGLQNLQENISDIAKELEKTADKFGKGVKYSEALEAVSKLDTKLSFNELYKYSEAAEGWVLTQVGIEETINSIIKDNQKKAEELKSAAQLRSSTLTSLTNGYWLTPSMSQETFQKMTGLEDTELETEYANYQQLVQDFEKSGNTNFREYLKEQLEQNNKYLEEVTEITDDLAINVLDSTLSGVNYIDLAGGKDVETNKVLIRSVLKAAGVGEKILSKFDSEIWPQMIEGHFEGYNDLLKNLGFNTSVSKKTSREAKKSNANQFLTLLNELQDKTINSLSEEAITAAEELGFSGAFSDNLKSYPAIVASLLKETQKTVDQLYNDNLISLEDYNKSLATEINKNLGGGRTKAVLDMIKDGFNISELESFATAQQESILNYVNRETGEITNAELAGIYSYDIETGQFTVQGEHSANEILTAVMHAFGITIDDTTKTASELIDEGIANRAKENRGMQIKEQLSKLSSVEVGEEVNISLLTDEMKSAVGLEKSAETIKFESENARDRFLLLLQEQIESYTGEGAELLQSWYKGITTTIKSKKAAKGTAIQGIIGKTINISAMKTFAKTFFGSEDAYERAASMLGFSYDKLQDLFIAGNNTATIIQSYIDSLPNIDKNGNSNKELKNNLTALVNDLKNTEINKPINILREILNNATNVTEQMIADFNTAFDIDLRPYLVENRVTGQQELDLIKFKSENISVLQEKLGSNWSELFDTYIAQLTDSYIDNIQKAVNFTSTGTTSKEEIQTIQTNAKKLGLAIKNTDFSYDSILNAWTLDPAIMMQYVRAQAQELVKAGTLAKEEVDAYLDKNVREVLANNIDIGAFLSAENRGATGQAYQTLKTAITNYIDSSDELFERLRQQYFATQLAAVPDDIKNQITGIDSNALARFYIEQIKKGGDQAVKIMQAVAEAQGKELTSADIEAAYRTEVAQLEDALDQLTYDVGSLVSGDAVKILQQAGYELAYFDENNAVIIGMETANINQAYQAYYDALAQSGEATLAALNEAKAKVLETQGNRAVEQQAIDALGDAMGMSYTRFADIFTQAGIELTDTLMEQLTTDNVIESMGGNKMRITDFSRFAQAMGWQFNSEEYVSAFKTYNDSLIKMNKDAESSILEEVKSISSAKGGDQLNLTKLFSELSNELTKSTKDVARMQPLQEVQNALLEYGASLKDGILTLSENANILGVAQTLRDAAKEAGVELAESMAELEDSIRDIIHSYVTAIQNGIKGALSSTEKLDLTKIAASWGIKDLDFSETTEGFKLAEASAIKLYSKLKDIDAIQASLVFDDLRKSLEETNQNFSTTTNLLAHVQKLRNGIYLEDDKVSNARLEQYQAELEVAEEILAARATSEDSSFKFMENKIPAAQNNPINYVENWTKAFNVMKETTKGNDKEKGFMAYEDFYNIVTELSNLAATSDQVFTLSDKFQVNATNAAELIEQGANALKIASDGTLKVDLSKLGIDFSTGAADLKQQVGKGIQSVAKSQIQMIEALIQMLELIAAMEELGDITGEDTHIDLGDVFAFDGIEASEENLDKVTDFTEKYKKAREKLIAFLDMDENKEIKSVYEHTKLSFLGKQQSMYDLLSIDDFKTLFPDTLDSETKQKAMKAYQGMLESFYQAAISGNYDLDHIAESVQQILKDNNIDLSNFIFEITDDDNKVTRVITFAGETLVDIDFTDQDTRKLFDTYFGTKYEKDEEGYREYLQEQLEKYQTGKEQGTLTLEDEINIRREVGVASQEFRLSTSKDNKTLTGSYGGQTFKAENGADAPQKLLGLMAQAAMMKDRGYDFKTIEIEGGYTEGIKGITTIGGVTIDVTIEDGELKYTYGEHKASDPKELLGYIAKDGKLGEIDVGTYTFEEDGKKYNIKVKEHAQLNLKYSITTDEKGNIQSFDYGGQHFDDYDTMYKYMSLVGKYDPTGEKGSIIDNPDGSKTNIITINKEAQAKIKTTFTPSGVESEFIVGDQTFTGDNGEKVFDAITSILEKDNSQFKWYFTQNGTTYADMVYYYLNQPVSVKVNCATGEAIYSWTSDDDTGMTLEANTPEEIEAAIAAAKGLKDTTVNTPQGITITLKSQAKVKVVLNADGKYEIAEGQTPLDSADSEQVQTFLDSLNSNLEEKNLTQPVNVKASQLNITTDGESQVTVTGELTPKPLESVSVKVNNLELDTSAIQGESIGQQIVNAIQSFLDSNPLNLKYNFKLNVPQSDTTPQEESEQPTNTSIPTMKKEVDDLNKSLASTDTSKLSEGAKAISDTNAEGAEGVAKASNEINAEPAEGVADAISQIEDDKAYATMFAINGIEPAKLKAATEAINAILDSSASAIERSTAAINSVTDTTATSVDSAVKSIKDVINTISSFTAPVLTGELTVNYSISGGSKAKGTTGNNALAGGRQSTLMGELGPELVVSNGRYFLVGQNGAEFVDLAKDAIVFNHLQTQRLMDKGAINSHGKPVTNERNAVSKAKGNIMEGPAHAVDGDGSNKKASSGNSRIMDMLTYLLKPDFKVTGYSPASQTWDLFGASAKGNISGPAYASGIRAAIGALKQLLAQWKSLQNMSLKDFGALGGSGGGGGGGNNKEQMKNFIHDLEKWYNWLQEIAKLEQIINKEEARREAYASSSIAMGREYAKSLSLTIGKTRAKAETSKDLALSQQAEFERRRQEMNTRNSPLTKLYYFDSYGQQKMQNGAAEFFSDLWGRNPDTNQPNHTVEEQYQMLYDMGLGEYMKYDSSGNEIDTEKEGWQQQAVQAVVDIMEAEKAEMQSLHDDSESAYVDYINDLTEVNKQLKEIEDNQIAVEKSVLDTIIDMRQREIDELQKERDAIEKASNNLINGLSQQLQKEQNMYQRQQDQSELTKLQRQLAILQRSGGSASQITSLQKEISQKQQDAYFDAQQAQIDLLQEASDNQLKKLDEQIALMTETLNYQKEYGLLWNDVYDVLSKHDENGLADWIGKNNSKYWSMSETERNQTLKDDLFNFGKFYEFFGDQGALQALKDTQAWANYMIQQENIKSQQEEQQRKDAEDEEKRLKEEADAKNAAEAVQPVEAPVVEEESYEEPAATEDDQAGWYWDVEDEGHRWRNVLKDANGNIQSTGSWHERNAMANDPRYSAPKQAAGGYVGHGIYELGEQGTETVLTASQTKILRDNILSNRPNSLLSLLKSYNEAYDSNEIQALYRHLNELGGQQYSDGITIEHAEVNMNVAKIDNDYDAQRAGEQALNKILEIARKTSVQNRIGR